MIHYLRMGTDPVIDNTVVDATAGKDDLSVVVNIEAYTKLLMLHSDKWHQLSTDFHAVQELRGEYFEHPSRTKAHYPETPDEFVERRLREVGERWHLNYVKD